MRISDWSSDVCSSDLSPHLATHTHGNCVLATRLYDAIKETQDGDAEPIITFREFRMRAVRCEQKLGQVVGAHRQEIQPGEQNVQYLRQCRRSEEQTSERQYLMRISYATFALKKKKQNIQ